MRDKYKSNKAVSLALLAVMLLAAFPAEGAVNGPKMKVYSFEEVGEIAQLNSGDVIRQKVSVKQAEQNKTSQLSNYQDQVYNYYNDPDSTITESSLYSLQESYEDARADYLDAEKTMENLKPKVAYQAQKLYLDILQGERQIGIQELEIQRLKGEYDLARIKTAFGAFTQTQLNNVKIQWENALDTLDNLKTTQQANRDAMREYLALDDGAEFGLEDPPSIGEYTNVFDEDAVMADALKNSIALKQAQKEVDELGDNVARFEREGQQSQADRLAASAPGKELALKETRQSLIKTVEKTLKDYGSLESALVKAGESLASSQKALATTRMKLNMGISTLNDVRAAEKAVLSAEKDVAQAQYNCYLGAKKVSLLKDGVLV